MSGGVPSLAGERVRSSWHRVEGVVVRYEPLGQGMCDVLVREDGGRECWYASHELRYASGRRLPDRREVRRVADGYTLACLRTARAQHVRDFRKSWPGCEFGKIHVGHSLDAAIVEVERRLFGFGCRGTQTCQRGTNNGVSSERREEAARDARSTDRWARGDQG